MSSLNTFQLSQFDTASLQVQAGNLPGILHEDHFWPAEPTSLEDAGLSASLVESLLCQVLQAVGTQSGRKLSEAIGLPFAVIEQQLGNLRARQIVAHARSAPFNDYYYALTDNGQKRALQHQQSFRYSGPAPVPLADYLLSVEAQANQYVPIERQQLLESLQHISFEPAWLDFLGPAVNSNGGIFLYGPPGNGKSTLAKCLTVLRGESVWIPHAIIDDGMIIKLFDAAYHRPKSAANGQSTDTASYDKRWIRIERPTVVVGGELTLDNLEVRHDPRSNTCEAPLQLKSNCGSLLIDDFGRQRVAPAELLNRWIIPLENKIDYLTLPTGKKIAVPFEQIVLFSTNLQPHDLVDEAFLRRVPFKIEIRDPSEEEFSRLFREACKTMGFPWRPEVVNQLIRGFFYPNKLPLRRCYARDLLNQVRAVCAYRGEPIDLRIDYLQHACRNYFGSMGTLSRRATPAAGQPVAASAQSVATPAARPQPAAAAAQSPAQQPAPPLFAQPQNPAAVLPPLSIPDSAFSGTYLRESLQQSRVLPNNPEVAQNNNS
jgi:predicted ATPase with chaperone activity